MYAELWQWVTSEQFLFRPLRKKKTQLFLGPVLKMRFFLIKLHCAVNFFSAKKLKRPQSFKIDVFGLS